MNKELALESRIKEPVTLDNLRDVIKEAIEAGGYLTKEKLEEDTERAYNYHYSNNAIMIAFANFLGLEGRLYALRNGMLELPNIKRKDCEIVSDKRMGKNSFFHCRQKRPSIERSLQIF